jgi:hypothetical protein
LLPSTGPGGGAASSPPTWRSTCTGELSGTLAHPVSAARRTASTATGGGAGAAMRQSAHAPRAAGHTYGGRGRRRGGTRGAHPRTPAGTPSPTGAKPSGGVGDGRADPPRGVRLRAERQRARLQHVALVQRQRQPEHRALARHAPRLQPAAVQPGVLDRN